MFLASLKVSLVHMLYLGAPPVFFVLFCLFTLSPVFLAVSCYWPPRFVTKSMSAVRREVVVVCTRAKVVKTEQRTVFGGCVLDSSDVGYGE